MAMQIADTTRSQADVRLFPRWRRRRRTVRVRITDRGHEVDGFLSANPELLQAAVRPLRDWLKGGGIQGTVDFDGFSVAHALLLKRVR